MLEITVEITQGREGGFERRESTGGAGEAREAEAGLAPSARLLSTSAHLTRLRHQSGRFAHQ